MMTLSSISVGAAAPYASSTTPYPSSVTPTEALYVVSSDTRTPAELLCLDTLAGNLARLTPRLYEYPTLWEHSRPTHMRHGFAKCARMAFASTRAW